MPSPPRGKPGKVIWPQPMKQHSHPRLFGAHFSDFRPLTFDFCFLLSNFCFYYSPWPYYTAPSIGPPCARPTGLGATRASAGTGTALVTVRGRLLVARAWAARGMTAIAINIQSAQEIL